MAKQEHPEVIQARQNLDRVVENHEKTIQLLREKRHQEFVAKGGCTTCDGFGKVLTWSTLDGPGWDEFGDCPNPNCTAKTVGVDVTCGHPGSRGYHVNPENFPVTAEDKALWEMERYSIECAEKSLDDMREKWIPRKGKIVECIRTSKGCDKGDKGKVFWEGIKENQFGTTHKVGFHNQDGVECWTTVNSCVVTNPEVEQKPQDFVSLKATVKKETTKAYLMVINGRELWAPKSQVREVAERGEWNFPKWFVEKNFLR